MNRVVPWSVLVALVASHAPVGNKVRPPFGVETMLRIHFMQQWFRRSDPAMEDALQDVPRFCEFSGLDNRTTRLPDESTILRFRHLLEKHKRPNSTARSLWPIYGWRAKGSTYWIGRSARKR